MDVRPVIKVEKLVFGGDGLGRAPDGKVVFVPFVIPGELVRVKLTRDLGDYYEAEVEEIIEESPYRRPPSCPYYEVCGGCQLQHIEYTHQLEIKKNILLDTFRHQRWEGEVPFEGVFPSPREFHYRNRLRLHVEGQQLKMGFVKRKTHQVLKIKECLLAEPIVNQVLKGLYQHQVWFKFAFYSKRIKIESSPEEGKATIIFWTGISPLREELESLAEIPGVKCVFFWKKGRRPDGPFPKEASYSGRRIFKNIDDMFYYVQPGVFVQTNWDVNLKIMEVVRSWKLDYETVLDLHAGIGNFLFPMGKPESVKTLIGVDTDPRAIEDAIFSAEKQGVNGRFDFRHMSAMEMLYDAVKYGETYDLVLLDPPRGGCKELLRLLEEVAKRYIVYVSCDLPTFVRDVKVLKQKGFELKRVCLFDMFPQTYHFETVGLLEKKS